MCDIYHFPEEKVACEYLAYLNQKKYPINLSPTIEILEGFENEALKHLSSKKHEKHNGQIIYNSLTLPKHPSNKDSNYEAEDDEDGELSSYYGAGDNTPVRLRQSKRQFSPDTKTIGNKKRIGDLDKDNTDSYTPTSNENNGQLIK